MADDVDRDAQLLLESLKHRDQGAERLNRAVDVAADRAARRARGKR
jgi:hypothetical protein